MAIHIIRKNLTEDQKRRGVVYSSELAEKRDGSGSGTVHEILNTVSSHEKSAAIERLENTKFFNDSHWKFNIVRQ